MTVATDHPDRHAQDHHGHDHEATIAVVPPPGPIVQSVTIGFLAIYAATLLLGLVWLTSNARQIAPDAQAVVFRFGRLVRTQQAGLLLALPRPIEQVALIPGPDRQLSQAVQPLPPSGGLEPADADTASSDPAEATTPRGASPHLTGDGNVVLVDATLIYRITDPRRYILARDHVGPALDRLFRTAAAHVAAAHGLNDFLVSRTAGDAAAADAGTSLRAAVRETLLQDINGRLAVLDTGAGLGIEVTRIDLTAWLPAEAKVAFDAVLTATQLADQAVAAARTDGERRRQAASRERDRLVSAAQAAATEWIAKAHIDTAPVWALHSQATPQTRATLVLQAYRAGVGAVLRRAGAVTLVDPLNGARVILSGQP